MARCLVFGLFFFFMKMDLKRHLGGVLYQSGTEFFAYLSLMPDLVAKAFFMPRTHKNQSNPESTAQEEDRPAALQSTAQVGYRHLLAATPHSKDT